MNSKQPLVHLLLTGSRLKIYGYLIPMLMLLTAVGECQVLRVGVVGLSHDHAHGIMHQFKQREVNIVGIVESDKNLIDRYMQRYQLAETLFFKTTSEMLDKLKPDAVLAYNPIVDPL